MVEKLDIHGKEKTLAKQINLLSKANNKEVLTDWLKEKKLKNKSSAGTLARQLQYYLKFDSWFKKDFRNIKQKELENLVSDLQEKKIKKENGKPYENRGLSNNLAELKALFVWIIKKYPKNKIKLDLEFINTEKKDLEISALDMETEIKQLIERASSPLWKANIRILSDGGLRIEEYLNATWGDLVFDKMLGCYMIRIRISKTKPRTISLALSTKEINEYRDTLSNIKPDVRVCPIGYDSVKKYLKIHGKRVLGKNVYPHLLRHTSATYYANKLNYFQMCNRFGWSFNSPMVQRYIDRNGIAEKETAKEN